MRHAFPRTILLATAVAFAACADLPTNGATAPSFSDTDAEAIATSFDAMSDAASRDGDDRAAAEYADGALALRLGARPTEIAVTIRGQGYRYYAVVTGVVERTGTGPELLRRTVVAWNRPDHPDAILRLTSRSDAAVFGRIDAPEDAGRATGSWVDLASALRFAAVEGGVSTTLSSTGGPCPIGQRDARFTCHLASFSLRLDGTFELVGDATARVAITSQSPRIAGVVVQRTGSSTTDRPTGTTTRSLAGN